MPRVVFMCGPAGSGKSTVARRLEQDGLVRLSVDDEARRRGITSMPLSELDRISIERDLHHRLGSLLVAGRDVVLDFSFWSRAMRDSYRDRVETLGGTVETVFVRTPRDVALARVAARRAGQPDYPLPAELAASYYDNFETPTEDEGPLTIVSGTE